MSPYAVALAIAKHVYMLKCWCVSVSVCILLKGASVQLCIYPERLCVCSCVPLVTILLVESGADTS